MAAERFSMVQPTRDRTIRQGDAYIEQAFRWAHEADPHALLFYNENGAEGTQSQVRRDLRHGEEFQTTGRSRSTVWGCRCTFRTSTSTRTVSMQISRVSRCLGFRFTSRNSTYLLPWDSTVEPDSKTCNSKPKFIAR